jgi:galactokinase/mevalonate kinase-like predicted kinase
VTARSASAPLRIDLTGGYTDHPEIAALAGGVAINAAIGLRTTVRIGVEGGGTGGHSAYRPDAESPIFAARLVAAAAQLAAAPVPPLVHVSSEGPRGCGLGSSGALAVAVVGVLAPDLEGWEVVDLARRAEAAAGNECGMQDEAASVFGGVGDFVLHRDGSTAHTRLGAAARGLIERDVTIWHKAAARSSGDLVDRILAGLREGDRRITASISELTRTRPLVRDALQAGDRAALIEGIRAVHAAQLALDDSVVPDDARRLIASIERDHRGAAKLEGGGGSGAVLLAVTPPGSRDDVARGLVADGYSALPLRVEETGMLRDLPTAGATLRRAARRS